MCYQQDSKNEYGCKRCISNLEWPDVLKLADHVVLGFLEVLGRPWHLFKDCAWISQLIADTPLTLHSFSSHARQIGITSQPLSFHIGHGCKAKAWILGEPVVFIQDSLLEEFLGSQLLGSLVVFAKLAVRKQSGKAANVPIWLVEEVDWLLPLCWGKTLRSCLIAIIVKKDFRRTID